MNWRVWDALEAILCDQRICPILAVVPDNLDDVLRVSAPDEQFWERVREWQGRGWTIAMHGWQHRFVTTEGGILKVNRYSEFAGLPRSEQQHKLSRGREIFEREGLASDVFVAPAHSFDAVTLQVLAELGFRYISDGYFHVPVVDEFGITWIPQQLWSYRQRPFGVWTICFHINSWTHADIAAFRERTLRYRGAISCFSGVVEQSQVRRRIVFDLAAARVYRSAIKFGALGKAKMKRLIAPPQSKPYVQQPAQDLLPKGQGGTTPATRTSLEDSKSKFHEIRN
jgi:peptidoglycan/xylan/chitin deacetylase (PgdA/CDA1 family)